MHCIQCVVKIEAFTFFLVAVGVDVTVEQNPWNVIRTGSVQSVIGCQSVYGLGPSEMILVTHLVG